MAEVYLIMVKTRANTEVRVGPVYRTKSTARSWVQFVKSAWLGAPTRVKTVRVQMAGGKPTEKAKLLFLNKYNIDLS